MTFLNKTVAPKSLGLLLALFYCLLAMFALFTSNARATEPGQNTSVKIWTVGDSRVEGFRPVYESYRFELWKKLIDENLNVDFIGQNRDIGSYPRHRGQSFDRDHDGYGGATSQDILQGVEEVLSGLVTPDIMLLGIGGNDLLDSGASVQSIRSNIQSIIAIARERNPRLTVFIEQIAPTRSDILTPQLRAQIESLNLSVSSLAAQLNSSSSKVMAVDMYSGWSDAFMADEVHYNEQGARVVAERYYRALQNLFTDPTSPDPTNPEPDPVPTPIPVPGNAANISLAPITLLLLD
ncbi:MAG: hypothetical protein KTR16_16005 [Acidiferrobacterales bacterium]|nr:hypothetical protein [Acidiferrobacterales bacterium]